MTTDEQLVRDERQEMQDAFVMKLLCIPAWAAMVCILGPIWVWDTWWTWRAKRRLKKKRQRTERP